MSDATVLVDIALDAIVVVAKNRRCVQAKVVVVVVVDRRELAAGFVLVEVDLDKWALLRFHSSLLLRSLRIRCRC